MINIEDVSLAYGKNKVLKNVSFSVPEGIIMGLGGTSGAGKTSLLKSMAYLLRDYIGTITYDDKDIRVLSPKERASTVGFVFQDYTLFANMTVLQNCARPLEIVLGMTKEKARAKALSMLELVGMVDKAQARPSELSGGQQQRVAIARALGLRPQVLLMDEPTAALDPENRENLKGVLRELVSAGITIVICSHDIPFVSAIADKILTLRSGGIEQT